jgi:hypothetical protein
MASFAVKRNGPGRSTGFALFARLFLASFQEIRKRVHVHSCVTLPRLRDHENI